MSKVSYTMYSDSTASAAGLVALHPTGAHHCNHRHADKQHAMEPTFVTLYMYKLLFRFLVFFVSGCAL